MGIFANNKPDPDRARLDELAQIVSDNLSGFIKAGVALSEIRDKKLYLLTHSNFADFIEERWNMQVRRAYQLITAAQVAANVQHDSQTPNARQAVSLASVPTESQNAAWAEAVKTAPKDATGKPQVTAAHVDTIAESYRKKPKQSRVKKPKQTVFKGKGWKIVLQRSTLHINTVAALESALLQAKESLNKIASKRAA